MAYSKYNLDSSDLVYMILTDRFCDSNPGKNGSGVGEYRPGNLHYYQGGDWKGIISKLPYIKELGFTALWMTAPQDNELFSRTGDEAGYHGYYTRDFNSVNPHFGTAEDLRSLIQKAEELGIKVIIDVQLNHTADYLEYPSVEYDPPSYRPAPPFDNPSWYHHFPNIINFEDPYEAQNYSLGGLDDLAQENPDCWQALMDAYWKPEENSGWFSFGFAGSRVDAVIEIPPQYLVQFENHCGKHCFGEAFTGSVIENSQYQRYLWGMLDYPLYFQIDRTFCCGYDWSGIHWVLSQDDQYKDAHRLFTFLDNHDRARFFANCAGNHSRLHLALSFLYAVRGIPVIYYGTEQELTGDCRYTDQTINYWNREMMPVFSQDNQTFALIRRLNWMRKKFSSVFTSGLQKEIYYSPHDPVYAFLRVSPSEEEIIICIFNSSPGTQERTVFIGNQFPLEYTDILDTKKHYSLDNGYLHVTLPPHKAAILTSDQVTDYLPVQRNTTQILIHFDASWNNSVYIRGDAFPLSWDYGQRCENLHNHLWVFEITNCPLSPVQFKVLLNDTVWECGANHSVEPGSFIEIFPCFN